MERQTVVAFVVLHYKDDELTSACVDSILSLEVPNQASVRVVVFDNASGNGSRERLACRYKGDGRVTLIWSDENLGFSRANNRAFEYSRDRLGASWAVILNNDIVIYQRDFVSRLLRSYEAHDMPHVIGPDIYAPNLGVHQSPLSMEPMSRQQAGSSLRGLREMLGEVPSGSLRTRVRRALEGSRVGYVMLQRRRHRRFRERKSKVKWQEGSSGCVLLGAAIVFTERFVGTGELPFDPPTFLFEEEQILAHRCLRNGWRVSYDPDLRVTHYACSSTGLQWRAGAERQNWRRRHEAESLSVLIDYLDSAGETGSA